MKVNGKDIDIRQLENQENPNIVCIQKLIHFLKLQDKKIAVQLNTEIILPAEYTKTYLKNTDVIEILYFAGGG